jgi:hypothetical protein
MPAESSEISTVQRIVCMHKRINKIVRFLFSISLKTFLIIKADILSWPKRMFKILTIDNLQTIIVNFNAIGIRPHLVEFILIFTNSNSSSLIMFQNSNDKFVIQYILHG